jgi:F-type H+-transporting ATPase subunit b
MDLVTPGIGLVFWTSVVFVILILLLSKFAWKPILSAIKEREENIDKALKSADRARSEIKDLQNANERLLNEARSERDSMLKEAREIKEKMIAEAKDKANSEAERILTSARETITNEKNAAVAEIKAQVATLSVEIAEKILRSELTAESKQKALANNLLEEAKLN